jgi:hypothetical protein
MIRYLHIAVLLICSATFAQQASLDIAVSKTTVTNSEPFTYQVTSDCDCDIEAPNFDGFEVLDRTQGQFTSSQIINGHSSKNCSNTITFILRAKKLGSVNIGRSKVKCKGSDKKSDEIKITVVDANEAHEANQGVSKFFYQLETNKETVYVGEPFVLTFSLYSERMPEELTSIVPGNALGTWRQKLFDELDPTHKFLRYDKRVKGKNYVVIELRKEVCFADNPGKLHIDQYYGRAVELYGFLQNSYYEGYSNSIDIMVKEVPLQTPENYHGMAGDFELTYDISETSVAANRAFELHVNVTGTGNFHLFQQPDFLFPESFLVNEPEAVEDFSYTEEGVKGSVDYTYVITPTKEGQYNILPYSFAYFNWKGKNIKSVGTESFTINVSKGKDPKIISSDPGGNPLIEDDIRFIHTSNSCLFSDGDLFFGGMMYWIILLLPLSLVAGFFLWKRKRSRKTAEEVISEKQKSTKRTIVKDIEKIKSSSSDVALKQLQGSLAAYFQTNLQIGRSVLAKKNIAVALKDRGVDDQTILAFEAIWDKIEMAQYAPLSDENIDVLANQTQQLIEALNKQL